MRPSRSHSGTISAGRPAFGEGEEGPDQGVARDCGGFADHCASGYTFFRRDTQERATADQFDPAHDYVYVVYDASNWH